MLYFVHSIYQFELTDTIYYFRCFFFEYEWKKRKIRMYVSEKTRREREREENKNSGGYPMCLVQICARAHINRCGCAAAVASAQSLQRVRLDRFVRYYYQLYN